ncbi:hypothetical protein [Pontibacter virosus]|uniref:Uncharacterized protein n=1 Tax=Pontibacter virosus TaxID=1765052 RepID=A0A2U1AV22_9BACT|nr:hypothetical protein [Pontibacter virosus]PVY40252.1 hypothetical protein C8E01_108146 [Pontibacter virosus]
MKKAFLIAVLTTLGQFGFGQELTRKELLSFYESAISDYYSQTFFNQTNREHLILNDSLPEGLRVKYPNFILFPVTEREGIKKIERTKGKSGTLNKITLKEISPDTMDIIINNWSVTVKRVLKIHEGRLITKNINYAFGCGGTMGYVPEARLVYNRSIKQWEYFSKAALLEIRKEELESHRNR